MTSPDAEHPQWPTGKEPAVASPQVVAVATVPDYGDAPQTVDVELWVGESPKSAEWKEIYECLLMVSSWGVAIGDTVSAERHHAIVAPGDYRAKVFGRPLPHPSALRFVLTSA
jgi:hypothetical protein